MGCLAIALLVAASGWSGGIRVESRTGTAARSPDASPLPLESLIEPLAALELQQRGFRGTLAYTPQFLVARSGGRQQLATLHRAAVHGESSLSAISTLRAAQWLALGEVDFSPLNETSPLPSDRSAQGLDPRRPARRFVRSLQSETSVGVRSALSRRLALDLSAAFLADGGLGPDGRRAVPFIAGPKTTATLGWAVDRQATLEGRGELQASRSAAGTALIAGSSLSYLLALDRGIHTGIEGGMAYVHGPTGANALPIVGVSLGATAPGREESVTATFRARIAPAADRYTGTAYGRGQFDGGLEYRANSAVSLSTRLGAGVGLSGAGRGARVSSGEAVALFRLGPLLSLGVGSRAGWTPPSMGGAGLQWTAFATLQAGFKGGG